MFPLFLHKQLMQTSRRGGSAWTRCGSDTEILRGFTRGRRDDGAAAFWPVFTLLSSVLLPRCSFAMLLNPGAAQRESQCVEKILFLSSSSFFFLLSSSCLSTSFVGASDPEYPPDCVLNQSDLRASCSDSRAPFRTLLPCSSRITELRYRGSWRHSFSHGQTQLTISPYWVLPANKCDWVPILGQYSWVFWG